MTTITRYPPTATTPLRRNRVTNPAMLTGSVTGWGTSTGGGIPEYSLSAGTPAMRFATTASGVAVAEYFVPATPGEHVAFSAEVRPFTTGRTALLRIYYTDAAQVNIAGPFSSTIAAPVGGFTTVTLNAQTAPANTAYARILVGISDSAGAGQQIYVTRVMAVGQPVAGGAPGTYFDGGGLFGTTGNTFPLFYYWEGRSGLSASREVDVTGSPDQIHPPDVLTPYEVTRESRSVVRALLESSTVRSVLIAAGPRRGTLRFFGGPDTVMNWLNWFSTASLYYIQDEPHATMWFGLGGGDVRFSQTEQLPGVPTLEVPFIETSAP